MPIYEYQCDSCGHHLETLQKISDPLLKTCPECGQDSLRKRVSAAAFRLKGGGWYETDFKDKKARKNVAGGEDTSAPADKDTKSAKKEETAKSDSKSTDSGSANKSTGTGKTAAG
ncbi:MAG: zinc ribbon domain-containing protein [Gammaproteobacteria bacterium]